MRLPSLPGPLPGPRELVNLVERGVALLGGAERLLEDVGGLLRRIEQTRQDADGVIARVDQTRASADALLADFSPPLRQLLPVLERLAETTDPREVDAAVAMIDQLPMLASKIETDVLPILTTLNSVAPDLHDLLDVSKELNEMLAKLPGMGRIKKRVEEEQEEDGR